MNRRLQALSIGVAVLVTVLTGPELIAQEYSAGFETLRIVDEDRKRPIHLDIWYPATGLEQEHNYGISMGSVATGGELAGKQLPVILLSHGAMGTASNYSWIAEYLARRGYLVLGVSHFGESPVFGQGSIDPAAAARFGDRTRDLNFALDFLLERSEYAANLDPDRVAMIGHSSGGAAVLMMAGAEFSAADLRAYCGSSAASADKGCLYPVGDAGGQVSLVPVPSDRPIAALVAIDPAVGPGLTDRSLEEITVPSLIIGSLENDFLPYAAHAGRIASQIRKAQIVQLHSGEGHFVYLDECMLPIVVMGVQLCSDRQGVDREAAHERLAAAIQLFLMPHMQKLANTGLQTDGPAARH